MKYLIRIVVLYFFESLIFMGHCDGAKILGIFPTPSYSHQQPMLALSRALAAKGHSITIFTTDPIKEKIKNLNQVDLNSLYGEWEKMKKLSNLSLQLRCNSYTSITNTIGMVNSLTEAVFLNYNFQKFLREENGTKYDLILYESMTYSSLLGIREFLGDPPVVGILTYHPFVFQDDTMGNPSFSPSVPLSFFGFDDKMVLWERITNIFGELLGRYALHKMFQNHQILLNKYFSSVKRTAMELECDKSLLIVTTDLATGYPRPVQPNTIYVGPVHLQDTPKPLPQDLQKWMDEAVDGVIYFSLGGNMKGISVPEHIRAEFIKVFQKFSKIRILWKWEADTDLPGRPDNVLARKWFPQQSVLAHPKIKVFISQVGQQSMQEALRYNVPVLGIPIFGDQDFNTKKLLSFGAGLKLELNEITFEEIYEKLKSLLRDPSYKFNMERLTSIMVDKPMSGMKTAIWWIEYVIRHNGAAHLRPAVLDISWYQYYLLDILFFFSFIVISSFYLVKVLVVKPIGKLNNVKFKIN